MVDMASLVFIGFLHLPPASRGQKCSSKDYLSVVVVYAFLFLAITTAIAEIILILSVYETCFC